MCRFGISKGNQVSTAEALCKPMVLGWTWNPPSNLLTPELRDPEPGELSPVTLLPRVWRKRDTAEGPYHKAEEMLSMSRGKDLGLPFPSNFQLLLVQSDNTPESAF